MKYENYEQASKLVEKIKKEEVILNHLNDPRIVLMVKSESAAYSIMTIGAGPSYEHSFSNEAGEFVALIREDIQKRIARLKAELIDL